VRRLLALVPAALLAGVLAGMIWNEGLREAMVRPVVALFLYAHYYVTHMPETLLWFGTLGALALPLVRLVLRRPLPGLRGRSRRARPRAVARGPVSAWAHTLTLALDGTLYRHRLRRFLRQCGAAAPEPEGREGKAAFLRAVEAELDAFGEGSDGRQPK